MVATSFNEGVSLSTMTSISTDRDLTLSATYTANGDASTYRAIFYREGEEVGRISRIPNGGEVTLRIYPCVPWPGCRGIRFPPDFHVSSLAVAADENEGACGWDMSFHENSLPVLTLEDGSAVTVDRVELKEELSAKGSYPYISFNRMDYTYDGGELLLTEEELH
jgi:hypothetical protein